MKKSSYCPKHPHVEVEQHCESHDVLISTQCQQNDHRMCERITNLACSLEEISAFKNKKEIINYLMTKCKEKQTEFFEHLDVAKINMNAVEIEIKSCIQTLKDAVQELERTLYEKFTQLKQHLKHAEEMMSNIVKKALFYETVQAITSKFGTTKQNIALNVTLSQLVKELEENRSTDFDLTN
ncbi:hypothetical protein DPMN_061910 [Dreissena polymorpha]|uniref:Uncharacterized protein n=1 Tax=Dreissena polymorpha TaxID=45954 RepID=A0A9D4C7V4_DREPO|nr:hypothetical protein DPMN_061910 [Dreissena polymorpha]